MGFRQNVIKIQSRRADTATYGAAVCCGWLAGGWPAAILFRIREEKTGRRGCPLAAMLKSECCKTCGAPAGSAAAALRALTVEELKQRCREKGGLKVSGSKDELIARLTGEPAPPKKSKALDGVPDELAG